MASVFLRATVLVCFVVFGLACGHKPPVTAPAPAPVEVPDRASSVCAGLAEATRAKIAGLPLPTDNGFGQCRAGVGGAWLLEVQKAEVVPDGDQATGGPQLRIFATLTFASQDGRVFRAPPDERGALEGAAAFSSDVGTQMFALEETFDWSDDGVSEVVLREDISSGADVTLRTIWTVREGGLVEWDVADGIETIRDVDGDGRPDILSTRPFEVTFQNVIDGEAVPTTLRHLSRSVPGGFETDGPVVEAYYRATCGPKRAVAAIDGAELAELVQQAICARLYGADAEEVAERVDELARPIVEADGSEYAREGPFLSDPPVQLK